MTMHHHRNKAVALNLLNKIREIDLARDILMASLETERAAQQLNKDLLELLEERTLLWRQYEQHGANG